MPYIMAIDQGTTATTVIVVDENLRIRGMASTELPQVYPAPNHVEHRPDDIWQTVLDAIGAAIAKTRIDTRDIVALGVTNQRETTVLWERQNGHAIHNAIVWQCRRTASMCRRLKEDGLEPMVAQKTGLLCDPYFSATKIRWLLDATNQQRNAENGNLAFGTIDSYLLWQLTGGRVHATDPSNASRTLLMNLETLAWDDDLLALFNIPRAILPVIHDNATCLGYTHRVPGLPDGIPIAGLAGDQQAALFGQSCFEIGSAKCTFGTGAFLLLNTGQHIVRSQHGLIATCAWKIGSTPTYALEGSTFVAGALIQWLCDGLGIIQSSSDVEALARSVEDTHGVLLIPALTGLGAPHWMPEAKGALLGLTRSTTRAHIARAALMGICQQNTDLLEAMTKDLGSAISILKADGGASINNLLMQMQADLLNCTLQRPESLQTTALGAAMLAAIGIGLYPNTDSISKIWRKSAEFSPQKDDAWRQSHRFAWQRALNACTSADCP
ncbi:MAG: glycerol kinase GlpK [Proteobacteria bacterium]|nr:glycerol kinase GlpK [Pseudomonadota bacterium]